MEQTDIKDLVYQHLETLKQINDLDNGVITISSLLCDEYPSARYGGGNPYSYCKVCNKSNVDINSFDGHINCRWTGAKAKYDELTSTLPKEIMDDIYYCLELVENL